MPPKISIVIPTLNEEKYLPLLLESIRKQSFQDYEIIVADAGSQDRTVAIAREAGAKVVAGGTPAVGRNRGAEAASGELLFFFDADVILPDGFLSRAITEFDDRFYDLATCEFKPISDLRLDRLLFSLTNLAVRLNQRINPRAAGFCIFITHRLFNRIGGFDETLKLAEDHDLVQRASRLRPLQFLESVYVLVSVRRLEKEGRFSLIEKYAKVEFNLLTKGPIREDIVEYEFGNFEKTENPKIRRRLDELEERIKAFEKQYNEFERNWLKPTEEGKLPVEPLDRLKATFNALTEAFGNLFLKK